MHLLNCLHPKRVFNQYRNEYVWVACRECEACRNARSAKWTYAIKREQQKHRFSFFVTLTYDESHLPVLDFGSWNGQSVSFMDSDTRLYPSKDDDLNLTYGDFEPLFEDEKDRELLRGFLNYGGIPYCSVYDIQNFHKRLNKFIHDKISFKYKNFRYFVCSEYGSTTFRPHFHGIYFVDDTSIAEKFEECVLVSWKQGRVDCQFVESTAASYVAQYVNKSASLPCFYKTGPIRQRFFFSRFPIIGDDSESYETLSKIFDRGLVSEVRPDIVRREKFVDVPLSSSVQNRLFGKCFSFSTVSDSTRIALYTVNNRFNAKSPKDLIYKLFNYIESHDPLTEFDFLIKDVFKDIKFFTDKTFNWVRRLYYNSRRFLLNCGRFGVDAYGCLEKIKQYWSHKELALMREFYRFQETYSLQDSDSLVLMYPEFCYQNFGHEEDFKSVITMYEPIEYRLFESESKFLHLSNRLTHLKNAYLDSQILSRENNFIYKLLKNYFYAKKCNEIAKA